MKNLKTVPTFLFLVFVPSLVFSADNIRTQTLTKMEEIKAHYGLPSLSIAIGVKNEVYFAEAIGYADVASGKKADSKTQYSVGSVAKPMTGLAIAKLVDTGKVRLEDFVGEYVKEPAYTNSFTVKELASHLAGVPHDTPERDNAEFVDIKDHKSPFEAFSVFSSHPLLFEPGSDFKYSSNGYILLSAVIEQAAQMNYVDFLRGSLWTEFQMRSTELDTSTAGKPHEASYYTTREDDGSYIPSTSKRDRSFLFGGGGFISTPTDLVRMAQATYDNDYLSKELQLVLRSPTKLNNGEINDEKYSLGWRVGEISLNDSKEQTWTALHHGGVTDNASTAFLLVIPQCKVSIAFATNYIPPKFWKIRGEMAKILIENVDATQCSAANKPMQPTADASAD